MIDSVDLNIFLDWCGICGGDNSTCKEERGVYNRTEYGYNSVVRIPSGKFAFSLHSYIYIYCNPNWIQHGYSIFYIH